MSESTRRRSRRRQDRKRHAALHSVLVALPAMWKALQSRTDHDLHVARWALREVERSVRTALRHATRP